MKKRKWLGRTGVQNGGIGRPLNERFWEKVDKNGPIHPRLGKCWVWIGSVNARGYGQLWVGSNPNGHPWADVVHRISYRMHKDKEIPLGHYIDHMCQNKVCVNPDHLRAVTPKVSALENNESVWARNKRKTHCSKGHQFTPENTAMYQGPSHKKPTRVCLTCYPNYWRFAVVPREAPAGAREPISKRLRSA